ncbi:MAG TPA: di-heme oxidoredictase family protein [Verrucomicrobiae bacterium]|nr:di-heme oxidoredictase family protein [Verrucomicrobiae bacterium]
MKAWFLILFFAGVVAGHASEMETNADFSGGDTTAFDSTRNAFSLAARNLLPEHRTAYTMGSFFFDESWLAASVTPSDRDGLGPMFVARSCIACHIRNGRGRAPDSFLPTDSMVVRISIPGACEHGGPKPEPTYGLQLQTHALPGCKPEAQVLGSYRIIRGSYGDGEAYYLRQPTFRLSNLGYGPFQTNATISPLVAPAIIGLGLLEAVPEKTLRERELANRQRTDGISGHVNMVWDATAGKIVVGRFGWKAEQPSVSQQVASAFNGDMGLTTTICPQENNTEAEDVLTNALSGGSPEVSDEVFDATVLFSRLIAVPSRRDSTNETVLRGEQLFHELDCAVCHTPTMQTGDAPGFPELSRQTIRPYTDLLVHDMGPDLSDHRRVYQADGSEWRTPPLWGGGLIETVNTHNNLLHDGRARGFAEAILWHGGEAEHSKQQFRLLPKPDRDALVQFLQSL